MCKEQRPLSTVKFLADALSLSPTANLPTPDVNQPDNDNENAPTPEQILTFQDSYLRTLARRNYSSSIPAQDMEEMRLRGLPPPSDEDIASAREIIAEREIASAREVRRDQEFARWRQTQLARRHQWLLDLGSRYDEPEEYETGDDDHHLNPDPNLLSANDDTHVANEEDVEGEVPFTNTDGVRSTVMPEHLQELGENDVQSVGVEDEDEDDDDNDIEFEDDLQDMVQMVDSDDVGFAEQGYHAWRLNSSEGSELEEGEVRERIIQSAIGPIELLDFYSDAWAVWLDEIYLHFHDWYEDVYLKKMAGAKQRVNTAEEIVREVEKERRKQMGPWHDPCDLANVLASTSTAPITFPRSL